MKRIKTKGFTLVEVLASILILSGTIVVLVTYTADTMLTSLKTEQMVKSILLAEGEMEKIKNTLRKSFGTDFAVWPVSLGNNYLAARTSTDVSLTLKIIGVSVGYDTNQNGSLGTDEIIVTFITQYAKRT
ncbi:MAG: prepilin-type N-terminal cleavage/methylation domain-containing protein [Phycisphaerae bacterium]|nr:prepilin-type N-terminal cleavage/methylation domain-containing protein [Phycisphaerae bacterium]